MDSEAQHLISHGIEGSSVPGPPPSGEADQEKRSAKMFFLFAAGAYVVIGAAVFFIIEQWDPLQSVVFALSVVTGVGFGRGAVPATQVGLVFTCLYILAGFVLVACGVGKLLDVLLQGEITAVIDAAHFRTTQGAPGSALKHYAGSRHFVVGCINLLLLSAVTATVLAIGLHQDYTYSMYMAANAVVNLDSICTVDGVKCGGASGASIFLLTFAVLWCAVTYTVIGHFMISASAYLGSSQDANAKRVRALVATRSMPRDASGPTTISRCDFLRESLVRDGLCRRGAVDAILQRFDAIDIGGAGHVSRTALRLP